MKCAPLLTWRVVGWDAQFETRGTLRQRGPRGKITVTTNVEGDELGRLLDASGGFLAFGMWNLVCRLAATCARRGVLVKDGLPISDAELARLARFPLNLVQPTAARSGWKDPPQPANLARSLFRCPAVRWACCRTR